jgi:putative sigma-54 modulation protein
MTINIHAVHFTADKKLLDYVDEKVKKLNTFHDRITNVDVYLKLDNIVHALKDKVVEIRVSVPKQQYFVKQTSKSFEESFDVALASAANQIKRGKEKLIA